ncbi:DNA polymerase III subunit beta [Rhizobium leguminosarum]|uniref:DNA polymerase III subunit beta n=1 Tax=Rhizobium leguminosarum TaxID=384 RepID=UPI0015D9ED0C|nr:DNA polymerase III subunit beta [Rhizobium leguminosarum]NZD50508.1 DNA polymerase III subunit beta [Rhizobium leguminosarum]
MRLSITRQDLARVVGAVGKVVESRNTIPILSNLLLSAEDGQLQVTGTDLDIQATASAPATITEAGSITVSAKMLGDIARKAGNDIVELSLADGKLEVKSGRSKFSLNVLPASDYPSLSAGTYDAEFEVDLAGLFAPVAFAISNEEVRYYLNGIFLHSTEEGAVAVATDGHRLARNTIGSLGEFAGVIVPRKTVSLTPKGTVTVSVSETKIKIVSPEMTLVSKLIDGTFPDYQRVIPVSNENVVSVDRDAILKASERVSTVSSERGRAVKMSIAPGSIALHVSNPDSGSADDEIAADYSGEPIDIGFNSLYVRDVFGTLPSGPVTLALNDGGSPALITGGAEGLTLVLMPMRV